MNLISMTDENKSHRQNNPHLSNGKSPTGDSAQDNARYDSINGKSFLIVEDEALVALDAASILEDAGAVRVVTATTCEKALLALQESRFDAALLDVKIGANTSIDVAAALERQGVPFIYATGYFTAEKMPDLGNAVCAIYKPYDADELKRALAEALQA